MAQKDAATTSFTSILNTHLELYFISKKIEVWVPNRISLFKIRTTKLEQKIET